MNHSLAKKITSVIGFALFATFASLQTNDVSQYHTASWLQQAWLYGYAAISILFLVNAIFQIPARTFCVISIIALGLAIFRGSQIIWDQPLFCFIAPEDPALRNPAGNETGGLVIAALWTYLVAYFSKKSESAE